MKKIILSALLLFCFVDVSLCDSAADNAEVIHAASIQLFFPPNNTINCVEILCPFIVMPVCGFSVCLGFETFGNACLLTRYNNCNAIKYTKVANVSCETAFTRCYVKSQ